LGSPRQLLDFQFYGTREEDVVLEMDMLMEILFEFSQHVIARMKGRAGIFWSGKGSTEMVISAIRVPATSCSRVIIAMGLATVPKQRWGLTAPREH